MTMSRPTTITATYRIVTPMFCAGADQNSAELRLPSFKGALRFWWRSLMAGAVNGDHRELRKREADLFGAADSQSGQSKVRMRLVERKIEEVIDCGKSLIAGDNSGLAYLGYGVMNYEGRLARPAVAGGQFTIECRFSQLASVDQIDSIQRALILLGTVGGLGSKSRKGYGSLSVQQLEKNGAQVTPTANIEERLRNVITRTPAQEPGWTAWSRGSRIVRFERNANAVSALNDIGRVLAEFRLWHGRGNSNFEHDHDVMYNFLSSGTRPTEPPERIAFGLPHNYFFRSLSKNSGPYVKAEVTPAKWGDIERTRRASPCFIHVAEVDERTSSCLVSFLPAVFLPNTPSVRIVDRTSKGSGSWQRKNPLTVPVPNSSTLWQPITKFLDYLLYGSGFDAQEVNLG